MHSSLTSLQSKFIAGAMLVRYRWNGKPEDNLIPTSSCIQRELPQGSKTVKTTESSDFNLDMTRDSITLACQIHSSGLKRDKQEPRRHSVSEDEIGDKRGCCEETAGWNEWYHQEIHNIS